MPVSSAPGLDANVARLAELLAGSDPDGRRLELARRVAEAQVDLNRVRTAKLELLRGPMSDSDYLVKKEAERRTQLAAKIATKIGSMEIATEFLRQNLAPAPEAGEPERVAAIFVDLSKESARLDRYERRTLSRRKFAVRDLDAAN